MHQSLFMFTKQTGKHSGKKTPLPINTKQQTNDHAKSKQGKPGNFSPTQQIKFYSSQTKLALETQIN